MTFGTWLLEQRSRNDVVGDLAKDYHRDRRAHVNDENWKDWTTLKVASARLSSVRACTEAKDALKEAWKEYRGL